MMFTTIFSPPNRSRKWTEKKFKSCEKIIKKREGWIIQNDVLTNKQTGEVFQI